MICKQCRDAGNVLRAVPDGKYTAEVWHRNCKGGSWCDCQHSTEPLVKKNA